MATEPKILFWDLENTAMTSQHWSRWNISIRPDATIEESRVLCFGAKWLGGKYIFKAAYEHGRQEMLETIHEALTEADGVVSWNGFRHDSKKIRTEFILEGMTPPAPWTEIDLMKVVKKNFAFSSNALNHVSQQLGVGEKVKHEGFFEIIPKVLAGDPAARRKFAQYQKGDVVLLEKLYTKLLPWIPGTWNVNQAIGLEVPSCTHCGSPHITRQGNRNSPTGIYARFKCEACGTWLKGARRLDSSELRDA